MTTKATASRYLNSSWTTPPPTPRESSRLKHLEAIPITARIQTAEFIERLSSGRG